MLRLYKSRKSNTRPRLNSFFWFIGYHMQPQGHRFKFYIMDRMQNVVKGVTVWTRTFTTKRIHVNGM